MGTPWIVRVIRVRTVLHDFSIQTKMLFCHQYLYFENKGGSKSFDQRPVLYSHRIELSFSRLASHKGISKYFIKLREILLRVKFFSQLLHFCFEITFGEEVPILNTFKPFII